jgi:methionyl-tRNA synthetase
VSYFTHGPVFVLPVLVYCPTMSSSPPRRPPFYITTAIDYVNAAPHLGHAYEKIATDVLARYHRLRGAEVFFLTGTDEHGSKIEKNAAAQGLEPKAFTDQTSALFAQTWALCNVQYTRFGRTTDPAHYELVAWLWRKLVTKQDIYKHRYEGLYCSGCEAFLNERDLNPAGECAIHRRKPDVVAEENYFFRLTAYKEAIRQHIETHPEFLQPAFRKAEVLNWIESMEDISVSRSRSSVSWGIAVPDDPEQVIYVWIDALSNYLTGLDYLGNPDQWRQFWLTPNGQPNAVHIIGKDILRFHAIYWPAMLLAAEIPLPKTIFAHGFITLNEEKISKSLGNVVAPQDVMAHYSLPNADPLRYYLMAVTPFGHDGNFTLEDFKTKVNADLANNLGNLLNRTLSMLKKYCDGAMPDVAQPLPDLLASAEEVTAMAAAYERFEIQEAMAMALAWVDRANKAINDLEPWTLYKTEQFETLNQLMAGLLGVLRQVAIVLSPVLPTMSQAIWTQLGLTGFATLTWTDVVSGSIPAGTVTAPAGPIFPRLESELVGAVGKKGTE